MKTTPSITLRLNAWVICIALVFANLITIGLWKPWSSTTTKRTIQMSGEAFTEATPDQYSFYPYFEAESSSTTEANKALTQKTNEVVAKLKELGVKEEQIKIMQTAAMTYEIYPPKEQKATVSITIKVADKVLAQKIQDYIQSTDAKGTLTPTADFADATRKKLEANLREQALTDAKTKASQAAEATGARLGKVITIQDSSSSIVYPMMKGDIAVDSVRSSSTTTVLVGQNELRYSVQVTYALK